MKEFLHSFRNWINEDSRSSIMGNLGMSDAVADEMLKLVQRASLEENAAFLLLKIFHLYEMWRLPHYLKNLSNREVKREVRTEIERLAKEGHLRDDVMGFWTAEMPLGSWGAVKRNDRSFIRSLRNAKTWDEAKAAAVNHMEEIEREKERAELQRVRDTIVLEYDDGWYWRKILDCDIQSNAKEMQHCSSKTGTIVSLRDPNHKPHVTMDWDEENGTILQAKGKQNAIPLHKYWPFIYHFVISMGVKYFSERGAAAVDGEAVDDALYDAVHANTDISKYSFYGFDSEDLLDLPSVRALGEEWEIVMGPDLDENDLMVTLAIEIPWPKEWENLDDAMRVRILQDKDGIFRQRIIKKITDVGSVDGIEVYSVDFFAPYSMKGPTFEADIFLSRVT